MISEKLAKTMNEQIKNELESAYLYLSMAAWFHARSLDGMAHWMRCQAHEETIHAMKFFDHLNDRGYPVALQDLKQAKTDWENPIQLWEDTLQHERFITSKIDDLTTIAREARDYAVEPLLAWFSKEQVEEEATAARVLEQMKMAGSDRSALIFIDRELGGRVFVAGSPFDPTAYNTAT